MSQNSSLRSELFDCLPEFVALDDRYLCPVCRRVLKHAMQTACGHRLCQSCLAELLQRDDGEVRCPANEVGCEILNEGEHKVFNDFCARREVKQLQVYCPFRKYGCQATPAWSELEDHIKNCEYMEVECPFKDFGCSTLIPGNILEKHIQSECDYRPRQCSHCHVQIPLAKMEDHIHNLCLKVTVPCPHKCGAVDMPREKLEEHLINCPSKPNRCRFHGMGCQFQGTQAEISEHEKTAMNEHLELLTMCTASMDLASMEVRGQMQEIVNERDILRTQLQETNAENLKLKETVQGQLKKIQDIQKVLANQALKVNDLQRELEKKAGKEDVALQQSQLVALQENQKELDEKMSRMDRTGVGLSEGGATSLTDKSIQTQLTAHDRQIGIHDVRLAEVDLHFQLLETASYDGILIWKIGSYTRRKHDAVNGRTLSLYSQPFYTSRYGYKMCARVYLNGDGMGKGTHMSFFFVIMKGDYDDLLPWPFRQKVTLMILDVDQGRRHLTDTFRPDPNSSSFKKPTSDMNIASGCPLFVSQTNMESATYKKNDTIYLKVVVETADLYGP